MSIPNKVANAHNTSDTFKPYDPNKAIGDISAPQPAPPATDKGGCGVVGQIIMVVVAVVVAIYAPYALPVLGQMLASGGILTVVAAGAIIGAAASVVSQGVGLAIGAIDKFSWNAVAMGAISGAVGAGLNSVMPTQIAGSSTLADVARGAAGSVITQGVGVATGLQSKFDWTGVAVAGVISGVSGAAGRGLNDTGVSWLATDSFANDAFSGLAGGAAGAATRSLVDGSNFGDNLMRAIPDIIGTTIGNTITAQMKLASRGSLNDQTGEWDTFGDFKAWGAAAASGASATAGGKIRFAGPPGLLALQGELDLSNLSAASEDATVEEVVVTGVRPNHLSEWWKALTHGDLDQAGFQLKMLAAHGTHRRPSLGEKDGTYYFGVHSFTPSNQSVQQLRKDQAENRYYTNHVVAPMVNRQLGTLFGGIILIGVTGGLAVAAAPAVGGVFLTGGGEALAAGGGGAALAGSGGVTAGGGGAATAQTTGAALTTLARVMVSVQAQASGGSPSLMDAAPALAPLPGFETNRPPPMLLQTPGLEQSWPGAIGGGYGSDGAIVLPPISTPIPDGSLTGPQILTNDAGAPDQATNWGIPEAAYDKVPSGWGPGRDNKKAGTGTRWQDPQDSGNNVRIDRGNPNSSLPSQQVDHVVVSSRGVVIGRDGSPINGSIKQDPVNAHIPLSEWMEWKSWNRPK